MTRNLDHQVAIVAWFRECGFCVTLDISGDEVATLSSDDVADLCAFGATDAMLDELRQLAQVPGRRFELDFERQTVRRYVDP